MCAAAHGISKVAKAGVTAPRPVQHLSLHVHGTVLSINDNKKGLQLIWGQKWGDSLCHRPTTQLLLQRPTAQAAHKMPLTPQGRQTENLGFHALLSQTQGQSVCTPDW